MSCVFCQLIDKWIHILFCRSKRTPDKASNISLLQLQVPSDNYTKLFSYRRRETPTMSNATFLRIYENQCRQTAPAERRSPHLALCPCVSPYLGEGHITVKHSNSSQTQKGAFVSNANCKPSSLGPFKGPSLVTSKLNKFSKGRGR